MHPMITGIAMPGFGAALRGRMALLPNLASCISLMIDGFHGDQGGTVSLRPDGGPKLDYPFTEIHYECFREGMKAMARAHLANGADSVTTFHSTPLVLTTEADMAQIDRAPLGPNLFAAFTAHQMGGCRMGADPATSVVDPHLRHHWLTNLFVADGSVFPTSLGVNPMESIYGIASWAAQHIRAALS